MDNGSSRSITKCAPASTSSSGGADADMGPPPPIYTGNDTYGDFIFLSQNITYTGIIESHYMRTTVNLTLTGDNEAGVPYDMEFNYTMEGIQEEFHFSESFPKLFMNDPILYENTTTDLYHGIGDCDGYGNFTTGNVSTNPHIDENGAFIITTLSGKKWAWYFFMLGDVENVPEMVKNVRLINDGRIIHYKKGRKTQYNIIQ